MNANDKNAARLLTAQDVADCLKISKSMAYKLIKTCELPSVRMGRSVRVRYEDLLEFIQARMVQP